MLNVIVRAKKLFVPREILQKRDVFFLVLEEMDTGIIIEFDITRQDTARIHFVPKLFFVLRRTVQ